MNSKMKKLLAKILVLTMIISLLPVGGMTALADESYVIVDFDNRLENQNHVAYINSPLVQECDEKWVFCGDITVKSSTKIITKIVGLFEVSDTSAMFTDTDIEKITVTGEGVTVGAGDITTDGNGNVTIKNINSSDFSINYSGDGYKGFTSFEVYYKSVYKVTYNVKGHGTAPAQQSVVNGEKATEPTDPTADGWNFVGWYTDSACSNDKKWNFDSDTVTDNMTLYAGWEPISYTVEFDANTGNGTYGPVLTEYDAIVGLPDEGTFTKDGYNLKGWNTKADGTGTTYTSDDIVKNLTTVDGSTVTLYAKWRKAADIEVISITIGSRIMNVNDEYTILLNIYPSDATESYTITSNKPEIATVDNTGKVTAVSPGEAVITVKSDIGGKSDVFYATVINGAPDPDPEPTPKPTPVPSGGGSSDSYNEELYSGTYNANLYGGNAPEVTGEWIMDPTGQGWNLLVGGEKVVSSWKKVSNPYAPASMAKVSWFYFDANGIMLTGWQWIKGSDGLLRCYYLNPVSNGLLGACWLGGKTPDGYTVDRNGAWTVNGKVQTR